MANDTPVNSLMAEDPRASACSCDTASTRCRVCRPPNRAGDPARLRPSAPKPRLPSAPITPGPGSRCASTHGVFHSQENSVEPFARRADHPAARIVHGLRVVDRIRVDELEVEMVKVRACPSLDDLCLRALRIAVVVEPEFSVGAVLEAGRLDHERVAFPVPDRVAQVVRIRVRIGRASVEPDPAMPAEVMERPEPLGRVEDLERQDAGQQSRNAGDEAPSLGVDGLCEVVVQRGAACGRVGQRPGRDIFRQIAIGFTRFPQEFPEAREQRLPVGAARCGG